MTVRSVRLPLCLTLMGLLAVPALGGCSNSKSASDTKSRPPTTSAASTSSSTSTARAEDEADPLADAQGCLDAWNHRRKNPGLASFMLASGKRGVQRVSVAFATGDACLFSFAAENGLLVQAVEVNPPSGRFTGLFPPGRVENFDPEPAGWNASANAQGFVTLRYPGVNGDLGMMDAPETESFPNESEDELLGMTPSDGWQCQRSDERTEGAALGIRCDPTTRISLRYESFDSQEALRAAYWSYFNTLAQDDVGLGSNCVSGNIGEGWIKYPGGGTGRLFCFTDARDRPGLIWTRDDRRILAIASGSGRDELVTWWREGGGSIQ